MANKPSAKQASSPFGERVKAFYESLGENKNSFAVKLGIDPASFTASIMRAKNPGIDRAILILEKYPEINPEWLLKGQGEMLKPKLKNDPTGGKEIIIETVDPSGNPAAVVVYAEAQAGYLSGHNSQTYLRSLPVLSAPFLRGYGEYRAFEIKGDSMEPTLHEGDFVFCRRVFNPSEIQNGRVHVVVSHSNGIVAKRVISHRAEPYMSLHSDNKYYEVYQVDKDEVNEIWYVFMFVSRHLPHPSNLDNRMFDLERKIDIIEKALRDTLSHAKKINSPM